MRKGPIVVCAALAALVLAVRLSGPRSERPSPAPATAPVPIHEGERPRAETPREPERQPAPIPEPAPPGPLSEPRLQSGDLSFGPTGETTPEGQVVYTHRMYFPLSGRGSLIRGAVHVTVDGRSLGAQVLPAPEPDPGGGLAGANPLRVLRVPVGGPETAHTVVIQFQQDQGRPRPALYRHTYRREAGPRDDWRMIRSQWAPEGVVLQDLEVPRRMGSMGQ